MSTNDSVRKVTDHMGQGVGEILDPDPTKNERLDARRFQDGHCPICGVHFAHDPRQAHWDYIEQDGPRALGNRLLVCPSCHRKRRDNENWRTFLQRRCGDNVAAYNERAARIEEWMRLHPLPPPPESPAITAILARLDKIKLAYAIACRDLQAAVRAVRLGTGEDDALVADVGPDLSAVAEVPSPLPQAAGGIESASERTVPSRPSTGAHHEGLKALRSRNRRGADRALGQRDEQTNEKATE